MIMNKRSPYEVFCFCQYISFHLPFCRMSISAHVVPVSQFVPSRFVVVLAVSFTATCSVSWQLIIQSESQLWMRMGTSCFLNITTCTNVLALFPPKHALLAVQYGFQTVSNKCLVDLAFRKFQKNIICSDISYSNAFY